MSQRLPTKEVTLTTREMQVAKLVAEGLPNKQIASLLKDEKTKKHLSERTIESYLATIFIKVNVRSRTALVSWVWRTGLFQARTVKAR
jgi:DNA-binding NarL/FixJ family response regulator